MSDAFDSVTPTPQTHPYQAPGVSTPPVTAASATSQPSAPAVSAQSPAQPSQGGDAFEAVDAHGNLKSAQPPAQNPQAKPWATHDITMSEYSALSPEMQKEYDKHVREGRSVFDPATGFIKGLGQTVNTLSGLISRVAPSVVRPSDVAAVKQYETPTNTMQKIGNVGEGVAEFFLGDEALKGLSLAERAGLLSKVAKLAESHPVVAKLIGHGLDAIRGGTTAAAQQLAHGATLSEAAKAGLEAGALGTAAGATTEGISALSGKVSNLAEQVSKGADIIQPKVPSAVKSAIQSAAERTTVPVVERVAEATRPNVPTEYQDLVDEAMKQGPSWTPAKAKPVAHALGDDFEVRGSVGEGRPSDNDLDIWAKSGDLSDAAPKLDQLGFKKVADTAHGETWTNEATGQNIDLWDAEHEPVKGYGSDAGEAGDAKETEDTTTPARVTSQKALAIPDAEHLSDYVSQHVDNLKAAKTQAYQQADKIAGEALGQDSFDLKAEKQALRNDKFKLSQLGNTDADIAQKGKLIESINDSTDRIAKAEQAMTDAGFDPKTADKLNTQWQRGQQFEKVVSDMVNPDGTIKSIDQLYDKVHRMRTLKVQGKNVDGLAQLLGDPKAADALDQQLFDLKGLSKIAGARQAAVSRAAAQAVSHAIAVAGLGTLGWAGYELFRAK